MIIVGAVEYNILPPLLEECKEVIIDRNTFFKKETPPQCYLAQSASLLNTTLGLDAIRLMLARDLMLIFVGLGLVAYGAVVNAPPKKEKPKPASQQNESVALDILNARLARGEITKQEYDEMKRRISDKSADVTGS
jgi:uncharacterized membrane protein